MNEDTGGRLFRQRLIVSYPVEWPYVLVALARDDDGQDFRVAALSTVILSVLMPESIPTRTVCQRSIASDGMLDRQADELRVLWFCGSAGATGGYGLGRQRLHC